MGDTDIGKKTEVLTNFFLKEREYDPKLQNLVTNNIKYGLEKQTKMAYFGCELLPEEKYLTLKIFSEHGDMLSKKIIQDYDGKIPGGNMIAERMLLRKIGFEEYNKQIYGEGFFENKEYDFMTKFLDEIK